MYHYQSYHNSLYSDWETEIQFLLIFSVDIIGKYKEFVYGILSHISILDFQIEIVLGPCGWNSSCCATMYMIHICCAIYIDDFQLRFNLIDESFPSKQWTL